MASSVAGGGRSSFLRSVRSITRSSPSISPNFLLCRTPATPPRPSSSRWLKRQLSSLLPVHSANASAFLVSNLSADPTISIQVRVTSSRIEDVWAAGNGITVR